MTLSAADVEPWLPALLTLFGGLSLRALLLHLVLPPLLGPLQDIGRRYARRLSLVSLVLVATATAHFLFARYGMSTYRMADVIILVCSTYLTVDTLRTLLVDHYWIHVRGHAVPRLLINVGEGLVFLTLFLSLSSTLFQLNLTPVLATSAVLSAVIGLALQDTMGSLFAGLALHADQPYRPGDWVQIDAFEGEVVELTWRSTKLRTRRNELVIIPNNHAAKSEVLNFSQPTPSAERNVVIGLAYELAPDEVKRRVLAMLADVPGVLKVPGPDVRVNAFKESSVEYQVIYHITDLPGDSRIAADVRRRLWYLCQRTGMTVPFPIRNVYLHQPPEAPDTLTEILRAFAGVDFLKGIPAEDLSSLAHQARIERWAAGEVLFHQGAEGDDFYILAKGRVRVDVRKPGGGKVTVATLEAGDFCGEMSMLTGEQRTATVVCEVPCKLIRLSKADFGPVLDEHPQLMEQISQVLAERAEANQSTLTSIASHEHGAGGASATALHERKQHLLGRIRAFFNTQA